MKEAPIVRVVVEVSVRPEAAFEIFTAEIGRWWRPGPINWYDAYRAVSTRIEPGLGGRWLELYDEAGTEVKEIARVTAWEPGERLVLTYSDGDVDGTEVEVRFEAVEGRTRVTLEHTGWERLPAAKAAQKVPFKQSGWTNILGWYSDWTDWSSPQRIAGRTPQGLEFARWRRREFEATFGG